MRITLIAAVAINRAIGYDNKLLYHFKEDILTDQVLEYDDEGLHRLIAMKICEFEYFEFKL